MDYKQSRGKTKWGEKRNFDVTVLLASPGSACGSYIQYPIFFRCSQTQPAVLWSTKYSFLSGNRWQVKPSSVIFGVCFAAWRTNSCPQGFHRFFYEIHTARLPYIPLLLPFPLQIITIEKVVRAALICPPCDTIFLRMMWHVLEALTAVVVFQYLLDYLTRRGGYLSALHSFCPGRRP